MIVHLNNIISSGRLLTKIMCKRKITKLYHDIAEEVPGVSLLEIKRFLKSIDKPVIDGHACVVTNVLLCENVKKQDCKIYVNKITGFFMCEQCKHIGPWKTMEQIILNKKGKKADLKLMYKSMETLPNFNEEWNQIKSVAQSVEQLPNDAYSNMVENFELQHIPQEIMSQLNSFYEESSKTLYFPLLMFHSNIVGYKTLSFDSFNITEKTVPSINTSGVIVYKTKHVKSDAAAVLVLNIEDLLVLASTKAANVIICLPHGSQNLPQQILPSLEIYKKLILWFGNDEVSWDAAKQFAKKLNEKRCYFVRPTDQQPQPKIANKLGYDLKQIIQNAQPIWHKSITTFHSLREDVLSDLQNIDKVQGVKWKRFPMLNKILKGHRRGEFTILTGPTGCGKTTFMSEYSLDLAMQGINTLWGSFEIRNARLAKTMLQQMVDFPLEENLDKFNTFADQFEKLPIYFMTFHGQQNIKVVMEAVEHATYVHDIAHIIIDNVQFMMGMSDEPKYMDRFWKQDKIIAAFREFATKFNCHVSLVIHPRKEREDGDLTTASIFGGAKASQEADNILIVQDKRLTHVRGKKYLQVAKNRYSGDLGIMVLEFDKTNLSYAQKKKPKTDHSEILEHDLPSFV